MNDALDFDIPATLPEAAVAYAERGWPIIPLMPCGSTNSKGQPSKEPLGELVPHGSKDATTDVETVREWWRKQPTANIGVVGMSAGVKFAVIDVDVHDGVDGFASITKTGRTLPDTLTAKTPSGGVHKFYKWTQGDKPKQTQSNIRDDNGDKILGVDVRGVNGYVVVYPSKTTLGQYEWTDTSPMEEFPEWAKRVGGGQKEKKATTSVNNGDLFDTTARRNPIAAGKRVASDEKIRRASAYLAKVAPAIQGQGGHGALLHAAEILVVGFNLDDQTALSLLWNEYNPRCCPPWNQNDEAEVKEFERKVSEARKNTNNLSGYLLDGQTTIRKEGESFTNYTETTEKVKGNKKVTRYHARTIKEVRSDLLERTGNWPRQIGSALFVFQPDAAYGTQRYWQITKPPALFAWLRETQTPRWKNANGGAQDSSGVNFVTMEQLYQSLNANAQHYEGISRAPHWPSRSDQFYDYGELPPPSEGHQVFWQMLNFFCLANETYRLLAAAFFVAPMFYKTGTGNDNGLPTPLPRPLWLIDTVDAQGSGKSTLAKKVALLYGSAVLDVTMGQLVKNPEEVLKRILSVEGRQKRVFLIDNVSGTIKDGTLASWITSSTLSGRAAYGHGDETRANDFTWCVTVNGAEIDTDTATRAYTIKVRKRDTEFTTDQLDDYGHPLKWESAVDRFITDNRLQIFADILDMLNNAKPRDSESRFPDFDACVLSAVCATDDEFNACRASIEADANGANVDAKLAEDFTEAVEVYLDQNVFGKIPEYDANDLTMLTHKTVQQIISSSSGKLHDQTVPQIRTLLKSGIAAKFSRKNPRLCAHNGEPHPEAITYGVHKIQNGATNAKFQLIDLVSFQGGTLQPRIIRTGEVKVSTLF